MSFLCSFISETLSGYFFFNPFFQKDTKNNPFALVNYAFENIDFAEAMTWRNKTSLTPQAKHWGYFENSQS